MENWDNIDRRKTIMIDGIKLQELREDFISFKATIMEWQNTTSGYRKIQCEKLDGILADIGKVKDSFVSLDKTTVLMITNLNNKILALPCEKHSSVGNQIKAIWAIITVIIIGLLKELFHK